MAANGPTFTASLGEPFGPGFFLGQLRAFARDRCPDAAEGLPSVQVHLASGEVLDLCHVVGLGPAFVALAVREGEGEAMRMRTELVPYHLIARVSVGSPCGRGHVGFEADRAPRVLATHGPLSPEAALGRASGEAAGPGPEAATDASPGGGATRAG